MLKIEKPLVSVTWLQTHIEAPNLIILDATLPKAGSIISENKDRFKIPKARFFDIKNKFSDTSATFPNTLPSQNQFQKEIQQLGINNDSAIIVYDAHGIYSSARAWWLFKTFGFNNVAVLDGGLPEWQNQKNTVDVFSTESYKLGNFEANMPLKTMTDFKGLNTYLKSNEAVILDARPHKRFTGEVSEPRKGLRSGTIPKSINVPYKDLLIDNKFKSTESLQYIFSAIAQKDETLVFSCGSGITACNLALGATLCGYKNLVVYDGSWTEYGSLTT
ncbi:sulfurtransferase [Winogradskyella immobilis]|uniref:Sulfurtransferase n=1 Tax=Winogradskyella immobilis TaxID=2816852 RepID=A0ABS8EPM0_9FLAO|nr:sulfurtransferase [Winogradskyella immobilis]MCC1485113.1 sulfurtransferase [Winogradskyella immobilis]MCG0017205.1 sulfurtransferase [Winogradskyella immobilis]